MAKAKRFKLKGALVSAELANAIRSPKSLPEALKNIDSSLLFRCPQCHQRLKVHKDHFQHVNAHAECLLTWRFPD